MGSGTVPFPSQPHHPNKQSSSSLEGMENGATSLHTSPQSTPSPGPSSHPRRHCAQGQWTDLETLAQMKARVLWLWPHVASISDTEDCVATDKHGVYTLNGHIVWQVHSAPAKLAPGTTQCEKPLPMPMPSRAPVGSPTGDGGTVKWSGGPISTCYPSTPPEWPALAVALPAPS